MSLIIISAYFLVSGLLMAALLTDRNINTNRLEALFCVGVGIFWPLAVGLAAGFGLFENIQEKLRTKRAAKVERMRGLCWTLRKMNLISRDTLKRIK